MRKHQRITTNELVQVQLTILAAVALQFVTNKSGVELVSGTPFFIIFAELVLAVLIGFTVNKSRVHTWWLHHAFSVGLLGLISFANISSLIFVLDSLIFANSHVSGQTLLISGAAIFMTNVIVYSLWYWEIDSPGLTRTVWSKYDKDFQFTHQDLAEEFPGWQPQFIDYLYLSITNAVNFAPADTRPLTNQAKLLMASQSLVSVFTLALLVARSVNVLGT